MTAFPPAPFGAFDQRQFVDDPLLALQGAVQGRYAVERELGRGGMGVVYLARDLQLDRPVAIKVLPPLDALSAVARERFLSEARIAARLSHPHIVPIYAVEQRDDCVFFVMAYVEGETLRERVRRRGPLPLPEGARLLSELCWAIGYAHARGIIHRDVKPDNVLIDRHSDRVQLADFGIAGRARTTLSDGRLAGTPAYMSPEQASGVAADHRSDIYGFGCTAFFAFTGRAPFEGDASTILKYQLSRVAPPLIDRRPDVPESVASIIDACLSRDPEQRPDEADVLAETFAEQRGHARPLAPELRAWLTSGRGFTVPLLLIILWMLPRAISPGHITVTWTMFEYGLLLWLGLAAYRASLTRGLLAGGFGLPDIRHALRVYDAERAMELAAERRRGLPWVGDVVRIASVVAYSASLILQVVRYGSKWSDPLWTGAVPYRLGIYCDFVAIWGGLLGWVWPRWRPPRRDAFLSLRIRFWSERIAAVYVRVVGVFLRQQGTPSAQHQQTEVMLRVAIEELTEQLPPAVRQQLGDIGGVVRRLGAESDALNRRLEDIEGMLVEASATVDRSAGAHERQAIVRQLRSDRDRAMRARAELVTSMETLRLTLLRLRVGAGTLDTASDALIVARELADHARALAAAYGDLATPPERSVGGL